MSRRKRCLNFQWRDDDPAWRAERENDRIVFRKIRREQLRNRKAAKIIRGLFLSPLWAPRLTGKSAESWRVKYCNWCKKCNAVQEEKSAPDPCKHGAERKHEKFYQETARYYPRPQGTGFCGAETAPPRSGANKGKTPNAKVINSPLPGRKENGKESMQRKG